MAPAETDVTLALYIGESFAEAHLSRNQKPVHFYRWYLGKDGLKGGLQKLLQEAEVTEIQKTFVASRFLEKIFSYRLGGSVAILATKGFENRPGIRQPLNNKVGPLSSSELLFGIDERCDAQGVIEKEISADEIRDLIQKLKQKQAKRICIHFLNAHKNSANQNKVKEALLAESFEVFIPNFDEHNLDELGQWRKNILNASLSGTFEEIQEELNEALKAYLPAGQRVQFFSGEGMLFDKENHYRLSSLWGAPNTWTRNLKRAHKFDILYLGLEQFCLLQPEKTKSSWASPWGRVQVEQVHNRVLSLQPTTSIELSDWGELQFSKNVLGYEPGPMFMGRGQIPTLMDLWGNDTTGIKGIDERRSSQGMQKFKNQIWALNKTASRPLDSEDKVLTNLRELALQKLVLDIGLHAENKNVVCMGALARIFMPELKRRLPQYTFELLPETETSFLLSQGH